MKTIRQIADELGVSKQAVYKRFKGKLYTVCAPYAHTEQGVLYFDEQGEAIIKQDFMQDDRSNGAHTERSIGAVLEQGETVAKQGFLQDDRSVGAHTDTHTERSNGAVLEQGQQVDLVAVLQATIDTLQGQLEVKDRQIEQQAQTITRLSDALVAAQQTAAAAQALHAGTMHQQLLSGEAGDDQQGQKPEPSQKRSWISRFFGT